MVCPPVRKDNPRALVSGLSNVQANELCSVSLIPFNVKYSLLFSEPL